MTTFKKLKWIEMRILGRVLLFIVFAMPLFGKEIDTGEICNNPNNQCKKNGTDITDIIINEINLNDNLIVKHSGTLNSMVNNANIFATISGSQAAVLKFDNNKDINIKTFINNAKIINKNNAGNAIYISNVNNTNKKQTIDTFINNGEIGGAVSLGLNAEIGTFNNYGTITGGILNSEGGGGSSAKSGQINRLNNYGNIFMSANKLNNKHTHLNGYHLSGNNFDIVKITLGDYHLNITQNASEFNDFSGYTEWSEDTSHLTIGNSGDAVKLARDSKIILTFGGNFEVDKAYDLSKLITNENGVDYNIKYENGDVVGENLYNHLDIFSSALYFQKVGDKLVLKADTKQSAGNFLYKNNLKIMGNLAQQASFIVFHKTPKIPQEKIIQSDERLGGFINTSASARKRRADKLKEAKTETQKQTRQDSTTARKSRERGNYQLEVVKSKNNEAESNAESSVESSSESAKFSGEMGEKYEFFFTPFISHTSFNKNEGGHSGLSYGFISGYSGSKDDNMLGLHFAFDYGELGNSSAVSVKNKSISFMGGVHYRLDFVYDLYLRVMGDAAYIINDMTQSRENMSLKSAPSNIGFLASMYFGQSYDIASVGAFGVEGGLVYQALFGQNIKLGSETFSKTSLNLFYLDIGASYTRGFEYGLGINVTLGAKLLFNTPKSTLLVGGSNIIYNIGVDRFLGYAGLGLSWEIHEMVEMDLEYLGNFGDKSMSHSGFLNTKIKW